MNRKNGYESGYSPSFEGKTHRNNKNGAEGGSTSAAVNAESGAKRPESNVRKTPSDANNNVVFDKRLPDPPPNYRGMIYDGIMDGANGAEGLDRLVRNDKSYSDYEKNHREKIPQSDNAVSAVGSKFDKDDDCDTNGLNKLIDGLRSKRFTPEDILLCAMILLMLNTGSDDDILMVLVLAMLL